MDDLATRIREKIKAAVAGVDQKVAEVKAEISEIQTEREKYAVAMEKAKKRRQRLARSARKSPEAKQKLKQAESEQRTAEMAMENCAFSLQDAEAQLAELEAKREEGQRRACWEMIGELIPQGQTAAREISDLITLFVEKVTAHAELLNWLQRLAHNGGRERVFATADLRHIWRCMAESLRGVDPMGWGKFPQYRNKTYADIFDQIVQGAMRDEPPDPDVLPAANGEDGDGEIMVDLEGGAGAEA